MFVITCLTEIDCDRHFLMIRAEQRNKPANCIWIHHLGNDIQSTSLCIYIVTVVVISFLPVL